MNKKLKIIITPMLAMMTVMALTGCGNKEEVLEQAVATAAYNDVSACYHVDDLKMDASTSGSAKNNPSAYIDSSMNYMDGTSHVDNAVSVHVSPHIAPHVTPHVGGSHGSTGHGFSEHSGGIGSHDYYTGSEHGGVDGGSLIDKPHIGKDTVNNNRSSSKLADGSSVDNLKSNTTDRYNDWFEDNHYYIPATHAYIDDNDNKDAGKDRVAYFLSDYILETGLDTSMNVTWKYDDNVYNGLLVLYKKNKNEKTAVMKPSQSDKNTFNIECKAVTLPTVNQVQDALNKKN